MRLSIRWRLTLWNLLALAVVLLGFGALVYELLEHSLYQRLDRSLWAELDELRHDPRMSSDRDERLRHWLYEFKEHENIFCVVYRPIAPSTRRPRSSPIAVCRPCPRLRRA
jgi:hypothetical protein